MRVGTVALTGLVVVGTLGAITGGISALRGHAHPMVRFEAAPAPTASGGATTQGPSPSGSAGATTGDGHRTGAGASVSADDADGPAVGWLSGAASTQASNGTFGSWRGEPVAIGGTWDNGDDEQVQMASICPGGDWATWDRPLDDAIGAIDVTRGETWAAAARGAYDARWTRNLEQIKQCWGSRDPSLLYLRFAHEMNLSDSAWRVEGGEEGDFVKAITRYSDLRYRILPAAKIVLCPNDGTSPDLNGLDIRKLWPGRDAQGRLIANVYAVDSYNMAPHVTTEAEFLTKINSTLDGGIPLGIEKHREFAERMGVPFAISEWGNNGNAGEDGGESPVFVRGFYRWLVAHAGDVDRPVAGQVLYEIQFNLWTDYALWPQTDQPRTAAVYRSLAWGSVVG